MANRMRVALRAGHAQLAALGFTRRISEVSEGFPDRDRARSIQTERSGLLAPPQALRNLPMAVE
jgi:hypothetical protein